MLKKLIIPNKRLDTKAILKSYNLVSPIFSNLLENRTPRPYQQEIIGILRDAIPKFKYIFLQLPTGDGKSIIAVSIAEYFRQKHNKSYYLLSVDHGLTAQYRKDFPFLTEVRGRNNFPCILPGYTHLTASEAPCTISSKTFNCPKFMECPYIIQRSEASVSFGTLSTPAYIDRCTPGPYFQTRFLSIRDEAHRLESFYTDLLSFTISRREYMLSVNQNLPAYTDPLFWKEEIPIMIKNLEKYLLTISDNQQITKIDALISKLTQLSQLLSHPKNVVIDIKDNYILFRPVIISSLVNDKLSNISDHTIFMSATFLSINDRITQLGLNPDECLYINKTESLFKPENRPIFFIPCGSMSYKRREKTLPVIQDKIFDIIQDNPHKRGIVICGSHKIRQSIHNYLLRKHSSELILTHENAKSFKYSLDHFLTHQSEPLIFITTRMEGLDFHGKLAEYLIIVNLPYPDISDKQTKARLILEQEKYIESTNNSCGYTSNHLLNSCEKSPYCSDCKRWYNLQVATAFQQGIGRIIRTPTDTGQIFILDSRFKRFYNDNSDLFLSYNKEAIQWQK
jgi:Rad3-related DNA helicase